ncbi:MAG TPA: hypothetical protein VJB90_05025 [Candidatus Nanoarchaeia archaeon]|nr:hypothetical protein [Candidatus Nanoarchaeia archaeon]
MRLKLVDVVKSSGIGINGIVAAYPDGTYLVHGDYDFYLIDSAPVRRSFGRRLNQLDTTLEETIPRVRQQYEDQIASASARFRASEDYEEEYEEEYMEDFEMFRSSLEQRIDALQYYFEHGNPFEIIEFAKIAEDGRLVAVYRGHRVPKTMVFHFGEAGYFQFYDEADGAYDKNGKRNPRLRLEPERTRTLRVFEGTKEIKTLDTEELKRRRIYGIQDISISSDGRIYVAYFNDQSYFNMHGFRDSEFGAVRALSPDFEFIGSFGHRKSDIKAYGGMKQPYFVGAIGENVMVADDHGSRILVFTRDGMLVKSFELDQQNLSVSKVVFGDAYIGISGHYEEETQDVDIQRCFPKFWKKRTVPWTLYRKFAIAQVYGHDFNVKTGLRIPDRHLFRSVRDMTFVGNNLLVLENMTPYAGNEETPSFKIHRYAIVP